MKYLNINDSVGKINRMINEDLKNLSVERFYGKYGKPKAFRKRTVDPDQMILGISSMSEEEKNIKNGLKSYRFNGVIIWAINEKTAMKKAEKLGLC